MHGDSPVISLAVLVAGAGLGADLVRRELQLGRADPAGGPAGAAGAGAARWPARSRPSSASTADRWRCRSGCSTRLHAGQVGAAMTPLPLAMMVTAPIAGYLSDRVPAGILGGIGMAINAAAMLLMALLPEHAGALSVGWRMALAGVGFGLFLAPNARLIVSSTPWHRAASAGGLISTNRLTGQTLGATLAAALLAMGLGSGRAPAFIACGLMLVALACSVARLRGEPSEAGG
ncbi:MAG: hypothetical protein U1F30_04470 [Steroidobacteraceae bacterium]